MDADAIGMGRNVAPVIVAHVLLTLNAPDDVATDYLASRWPLNDIDVHAAVAAAHVLVRRDRRTNLSQSNEQIGDR